MHRRNPSTFDLPSPMLSTAPPPPPLSPPFHAQFPSSKSTVSLPSTKLLSSPPLLSKQWLHRSTFLALFTLFLISTYVLLYTGSSNFNPVAFSPPPVHHSPFRAVIYDSADSMRKWKSSHKEIIASRPQISLTPEQELAAVSSFIISLPSQNVIPSTVDPSRPIDPQLVLDFNTRADGAIAELNQLVDDVWDTNPVVIYSKPSAATRELRSAIESYNLAPPPVIIDLMDRSDADVLEPLLHRITSASLPLLLIHGEPVDVSSVDRVRSLSHSGALRKIVTDTGAVINGSKRKKGRK